MLVCAVHDQQQSVSHTLSHATHTVTVHPSVHTKYSHELHSAEGSNSSVDAAPRVNLRSTPPPHSIVMAATNGGPVNAGGLFRLAPVSDELSARYRGIRALRSAGRRTNTIPLSPHSVSHHSLPGAVVDLCALSDASNLSDQPSLSSRRRQRSAVNAQRGATSLAIRTVAVTPGHIAVSLQHGRQLAVFDAVPSQLHLSASDLHSLHAFLHSAPAPDTEPFSHMLALHTADSAIVHVQFIAPVSAVAFDAATHPVRLLTVQTDASFLLWQWSSADCSWSFISRGVLPTAQQRLNRCVTTAVHCQSHNAMLWCESYKGKPYMFRASLPALAATHIPELTTAESAAVIPLTWRADAVVTLLATQHGVLIRSSDSLMCHYYHLATQQLTRLSPPTAPTTSCHYHVHAMTVQALCLMADGALYQLHETAETHSSLPLPSAPLAQWRHSAQLSPATDDDELPLFPLPPSALFFAFQQTVCVVSPVKQNNGTRQSAAVASLFTFFTLPGGVFIDRFHSSLLSSSVNAHTAALGFGGSGVLLSTVDELQCVVAPSVASLLSHLTAVSPHSEYLRRIEDDGGLVPSETFASASFTSAFPPLQPYLVEGSSSLPASASNSPLPSLHRSLSPPASLLIPQLPYPYLSHVGSQLAVGYGASLSAQREQFVIDRWLGCVTAGSEADILPSHITLQPAEAGHFGNSAMRRDANAVRSIGLSKAAILEQASACLQAPALPAAMTLLPSLTHYQHGHKHDYQQEIVVRTELDAWLARMAKQKAEESTHHDSNGKENGLMDGTEREADYRTPLNESLLPLLSSLRASVVQINSVPVVSSTHAATELPGLPSLLGLPSLVPLSTQLSRAMANRFLVLLAPVHPRPVAHHTRTISPHSHLHVPALTARL